MNVHARNLIKNCTIFAFLYSGITNVAFAGGTQTGRITLLTIRASDGLVLVELDGGASGKPACAHYSYWILKDETSLTGKQQLAVLVAAKVTGQTVAISGTGSCTRWPDGENIDTIQVQ